MKKPILRRADIWNMSMGFLGIQMGFALQNGNASRILQTLGADVEHLSYFWLVAPITGMLIQPIIGHYSDHTWGKWGRRKPYFFVGALVASLGLILMPNAGLFTAILPAVWVGAGMLMIMDASFNVAMEPFRALVGDKLGESQRTEGFAIQTVLIGIGAVIGSWLPYFLSKVFGIGGGTEAGVIPANVIISFVLGAAVLIATILWTIRTTPEYSPEETAMYEAAENLEITQTEKHRGFFEQLIYSIEHMPTTMVQLGAVQFFSWFALFGMWVYTTPAIATHVYGLPGDDTSSATYNEAADWVGVIFGVYNLVSAIYAFFLPSISARLGRKQTHALSLFIGGLGLVSIYFISNPILLILAMIGVGIAWASILAMPYAILAGAIPARQMGIYMGIFNLFITLPQITNGLLGGTLLKNLYNGQAIFALLASGLFMWLAAAASLRIKDQGK